MGLFVFKSTVVAAGAYGLKYVYDYFQGNAHFNKPYEHEKYMQKLKIISRKTESMKS